MRDGYYGVQAERQPIRPALFVAVALACGGMLGFGIAFFSPVFALMGLVGISFATAVFLRPEYGLLSFAIVANLLPFAVVPIHLGVSLTFVDVILTIVLAAWLFWAVQKGKPLVGSPLNALILVYLGLAVTSFVLGMTYSISPERMRLFLKSINSTLFFFGVLNCIGTVEQLSRLFKLTLLCGSAAAAIAIGMLYLPMDLALQFLNLLGPLGYPTGPDALRPIADTEILRAIGTSVDPNVLGGLLMLASTLLVGQLFSTHPTLDRRYILPMAAVTILGLLLTHSRSAFGGLVIGTIIIGLYQDRRLILLTVVGLAILPFIPQGEVFVGRLMSGVSFQDRGAAMRLDEYRDAINLITMYPWFGIGFGEPPSIDLYLGVSSMYLLIGQEMGLIGLASFVAIIGVLAMQMISGIRYAEDGELRGIVLSLAAALAGALAAGLLDHYFTNIVFPHMVALFWFYIGMSTVAVKLAKR